MNNTKQFADFAVALALAAIDSSSSRLEKKKCLQIL